MARTPLHKRATVALGVLVGLVIVWWFTPTAASVLGVLDWVHTAGPRGYVVYGAMYLVATLLMLPASFLQGSAGFLFGPVLGWIVASVLSTLYGTLCFLLARTVLRDWIERVVARDGRFLLIDAAIGDGGIQLVALLRVSPISPYNVVNYMLGLTQLSLGRYVVGTWLGSIVPVTLYTYLGSTVGSVAELMDGGASDASWVQLVGLITTIIATAGVTRYAQGALYRALRHGVGQDV